SAAESEGVVKRFAPEWLQRADELAEQGVAALDAGQLGPARDALRRARWQIPALPPELPANVGRVFGDLRLKHAAAIYAVAYSPDGSRLASAGQDSLVKVWDMANGRELAVFRGHSEPVRAIAFSPDSKHLASAGEGKVIKIWEATTGKEFKTLSGHT